MFFTEKRKFSVYALYQLSIFLVKNLIKKFRQNLSLISSKYVETFLDIWINKN